MSEPTAASAHNMIKAVTLEIGFVIAATALAGISDSWGSAMVTLMLVLLLLRGLFSVDMFASFAQKLQLRSTATTAAPPPINYPVPPTPLPPNFTAGDQIPGAVGPPTLTPPPR